MKHICGLDFGTSNSTVGVCINDKAQLVPLEEGQPPLRSAIFYNIESEELVFGEIGVQQYLAGEPGRLMMSLKSLLGSSLLNDKTLIGKTLIPYTDIIGAFLSHIKKTAENFAQTDISQVVMGRPVVFHTDPARDSVAQQTLEKIAYAQGFPQVLFQYEPLAAGFAYESTLLAEELVLVIDMGGGTSDFSIIKLGSKHASIDRHEDILANYGVRIGGTDFDRRLNLSSVMPWLGLYSLMQGSSSDIEVPPAIYRDLTSWHLLRKLYSIQAINDVRRIYQASYNKPLIQRLINVLENQDGHRILYTVETGKKELSDRQQTALNLQFLEKDCQVDVTQLQFNEIIRHYREKLLHAIKETLTQAHIDPSQIQSIFYTGGTTKIPIIREDIHNLLPHAKTIHGDIFGSVGLGLTLDAMRKFSYS